MKRGRERLLTIDEALRSYWGYSDFRAMQREIIEQVISGRDTLALLPTGGGKSLTYQVPAMAMSGVCIVITPLIALMKDQVDRLIKLGIPAVAIHSGLSRSQINIALDNCVYGSTKLLYVAPERINTEMFIMRLRRMKVSLVAVDEAHCISQWGYDFRPSYLKIGDIREAIPNTPILALTASATPSVCEDIMERLHFKEPNILRGSFARPNLSYAVRHTDDKDGLLLRVLSSVEGSKIIYTRTRKGAQELSEMLTNEGLSSTFYHGGLPFAERGLRQDEWLVGDKQIMVATNAFGMGIDKPDVRVVIHYSISNSLEAYYQEAGRAGRDGRRSYAVLIVSPNDDKKAALAIEREFPSLEMVKDIYDKICLSLKVEYGCGVNIGFNFDLMNFCATNHLYHGVVSSAISLLQSNGYLTYVDEMVIPTKILFTVGRDDLYKVRVANDGLDPFIRTLLRLYDGLFTEFQYIDEGEIARVSGYTQERVKELLKQLWRMRLIRYIPTNYSALIYLNHCRVPSNEVYISPASYLTRRGLYIERLNRMVEYANNSVQCRSVVMEEYFGVDNTRECGVCDICLDRRRGAVVDIEQTIINHLKSTPASVKELVNELKINPQQLIAQLDKMLISGSIAIDGSRYIVK
ncbi:MAG: ATP-dependent DNA helicase RecQ [Rikenellaceae bacterium]